MLQTKKVSIDAKLDHADTCGPAAVEKVTPSVEQRPDATKAIATAERAIAAVGPMADLLRRAKARIADPSKWIKGRLRGFTGVGSQCKYTDQFCMLGAIGMEAGLWDERGHEANWHASPQRVAAGKFLAATVARATGHVTVPALNDMDSTTHGDVMAAFDLAIEQAEKDGL